MDDDFAIVGYPSITHPAEKLCEIMQFSIPTVTIRSPQECREKLSALRDKGTRIIVGDMISTTCAQEYGMHGLLIVSGTVSYTHLRCFTISPLRSMIQALFSSSVTHVFSPCTARS